MTPVDDQIFAFLMTVLLGVLTGLTFDFYAILRKYIKPGKVCTALGDFLVWVILTTVAFAILLYANWGEVRFYVFIGIGIGVLFYKKLLSSYFLFLFDKLFLLISKIYQGLLGIIRLIMKILVFPLKIIKIPLVFFKRKIKRIRVFRKLANKLSPKKYLRKLLRKIKKK